MAQGTRAKRHTRHKVETGGKLIEPVLEDPHSIPTLGEYLIHLRESTRPEMVGIEPNTSRRAKGLRREEVASMCGVSVPYLVRLEQGTADNPSPSLLQSLASALLLDEQRRVHLFALAQQVPPPAPEINYASDEYRFFVDSMNPHLASIFNRYWDVLCSNEPARRIFRGLHDEGRSNVLLWMFRTDIARDVVPEWGAEARNVVGGFRAMLARYRDDERLLSIKDECMENPVFREIWRSNTVLAARGNAPMVIRMEDGKERVFHVYFWGSPMPTSQVRLYLGVDATDRLFRPDTRS